MEEARRPCRIRCRTAFTVPNEVTRYPYPLIPPLTPRHEKGMKKEAGDASCFSSRLSATDSTFSRHYSAGDAPADDEHDRLTTTASTAITASGDTLRKVRSARTETTFTSGTTLVENNSKPSLDGKSSEEMEQLIKAWRRKKENTTPHVPLSFKEFEAKMQAKIMEKLNSRKPPQYPSVVPSIDESSRQMIQMGNKETEYPDSLTSFNTDLFFKSNQQRPRTRPVKPVLANFPKLQYFQAPLRRLPTPWHCRPGTPLQRIYGSIVKEMPSYTERERQKLILQAVDNGHLYKKIKQAQSWYQRKEQLTDFKRHEAFVRFKGPVANMNLIDGNGKKVKHTGTCFSFKPQVEEDIQEYYDSTSLCDEESPVPTATNDSSHT